jgi:hypothetical protein
VDREIEIALTNLLNKSRLGAGTKLKRIDIFAPVLPSIDLIHALAALPPLKSLSLARVDASKAALLSVICPSLTKLRLGCAADREDAARMVQPLLRFKHLRSLLFTQPGLFNGRFVEFLCHPNLALPGYTFHWCCLSVWWATRRVARCSTSPHRASASCDALWSPCRVFASSLPRQIPMYGLYERTERCFCFCSQ